MLDGRFDASDYLSKNADGFLRVTSPHWRAGLRINSEYANSNTLLPPFATPGIKLRGIPARRYQGEFVGVLETKITG